MGKPDTDDDDFVVGAPIAKQGSADEPVVHTHGSAGSTPAPAPDFPPNALMSNEEVEEAERSELRASVMAAHDEHFRAVVENANRRALDMLCAQFPAVSALRKERDDLLVELKALRAASRNKA